MKVTIDGQAVEICSKCLSEIDPSDKDVVRRGTEVFCNTECLRDFIREYDRNATPDEGGDEWKA